MQLYIIYLNMYTLKHFAVVCNPPCENGACVATDSCLCTEGYIGNTCSTPGIRALVDALCRDGEGQISRERVQRGSLTRRRTSS